MPSIGTWSVSLCIVLNVTTAAPRRTISRRNFFRLYTSLCLPCAGPWSFYLRKNNPKRLSRRAHHPRTTRAGCLPRPTSSTSSRRATFRSLLLLFVKLLHGNPRLLTSTLIYSSPTKQQRQPIQRQLLRANTWLLACLERFQSPHSNPSAAPFTPTWQQQRP